MSAEVKKCPKCDGEKSKPWNKRTWGKSWWYRECQSCGYQSECEETQFMADYKWNHRSTVSMEVAQKLVNMLLRVKESTTSGFSHARPAGVPDDCCIDLHSEINETLSHFNAEKSKEDLPLIGHLAQKGPHRL